ncbi:hypothetical protein EG328_002676 [Venturia inaequalis]|uniref:Uncharacterized protein n=1 Tax=Venturia inaequalis TaxID=5025 RepID=A0A8H3UV61_VENIN|nr:hypothetical protein EG328_002676 [Venturia inaequalis]
MATKRSHKVPSHFFPKDHKASLEEFRDLCSQQVTTEHRCPMASAVTSNIPTYDLPSRFLTPESLNTLQDEWNLILLSGPGVFVVKKLYKDLGLIDRVNEIYTSLIASEKVGSSGRSGDYFSSAGLNSRIWNSLFIHCLADSEAFAQYYSNPWLAVRFYVQNHCAS